MANLPASQARGLFTRALLDVYKENIPVPSFLKSFFEVRTSTAKTVSIEVMRGTEKIAVDVIRGATGQHNKFSTSVEKAWIPPYYEETFDASALDRYNRVFGKAAEVDAATIGYLASDTGDKIMQMRNKIDRAKELQASQVLETGVVILKNGDNIDYKRKAASLKDNSGNPWSTTTTDVEAQLVEGAEFIRQKGKNGNPIFNLILSGTAWIALKKTDYFKNLANFQQIRLIDINLPQTQAFGSGFHGQITAGAYIFNVWTYDEGYETDAGVFTRYTNAKKAIIVPTQGTRLFMSHAGIPAIMRDVRNAEFPEYIQDIAGEYYLNNYIDPRAKAHWFEVCSAPLAVPVTVDMIYTMQILA
jgi:hypothetical protein